MDADLERLLGPDDLLTLRLLPTLPPARRVAAVDRLMDHQRQALAALAIERRTAVQALVDEQAGSVPAAAAILGVSRQAVYQAIAGSLVSR